MGFKEVSSLDADVTVALGKRDKKTGKEYPKSAEGYYLGSREVENKRGMSKLHFLQTPKGNLGVWGTTDLDRKMGQVTPGTMIRVTSTGTKPTPNGDMYTYRVEQDSDNTIEVNVSASEPAYADEGGGTEYDAGDSDETEDSGDEDEGTAASAASLAEAAAARKAKVEAMFRTKSKNK